MKIDGNRPNLESIAQQRLERTLAQERSRDGASAPATADRVQLSSDASLASAAAAAIDPAPPMRLDLIERMKARLADGSLGADAGVLADAMLGRLLEK
jgi:flagellar biosynthesis anti-sigma factor FlgM